MISPVPCRSCFAVTSIYRRCLLVMGVVCGSVVLTTAVLAAEHTSDSIETVQTRLTEKTAVLVDVREIAEWDAGHLQQARHVALSALADDEQPEAALQKLPKDKIIYCHCRSGSRCLKAADILKKAGYDVRPLKQGYKDLLEAGFPKAE
ncbi:MAG: rhodanese-like domain-containing protein [Planctomycetaceae bacterium]